MSERQELPVATALKIPPSIAEADTPPPKPEPTPDRWSDDGYDPFAWYDLSALGPVIMLVLFVILPLCCDARCGPP